MTPRIERSGTKLSFDDIQAFESRNRQPIPEPYRRFLLQHNGGRPKASVFPYGQRIGDVQESMVSVFFGITGKEYDLQWYLDGCRGRIPPDLFPIADDPGGNLVLIGAYGPREGKIYFWDHELEASMGEPPTERNIFFVAKSFDDFLAGLKELEIPPGE